MYYVYVLEDQKDQIFYIGFTENLKQRIEEHQEKRGGRTTRLKDSWRLIYYESYLSKDDALGREKFLKGGSGRRYLYKQLKHYLEKNGRVVQLARTQHS